MLLLSRFQSAPDIAIGVALSTAVSVLDLALLALLALRTLGGPPALMALVLMAASPLDLLIARRAWQDGVFANAVLLLLAAALGVAGPRPPPWRWAALAAAACWACLVKESGLLACGLVGLWLAASSWRNGRSLPGALAGAAWLAGGVAAALLLLAFLAGGVGPAREAWGHMASGFSLIQPSPGRIPHPLPAGLLDIQGLQVISDPTARLGVPWYGCLAGLWALSPATLLLALAGLAGALRAWVRDPSRTALGALGCFGLGFLAAASLLPNTLRWLAPVDLPLHALAGWAAWRLCEAARARWPGLPRATVPVLGTALLAAAAFADFRNLCGMIRSGLADPTIPSVAAATGYPLFGQPPRDYHPDP